MSRTPEDSATCTHCKGSASVRRPLLWTFSGWVHDECGDLDEVCTALRGELRNAYINSIGSPTSKYNEFCAMQDRYEAAVFRLGEYAGGLLAADNLKRLCLTPRQSSFNP